MNIDQSISYYTNLTPNTIFNAIETLGLECSGSLFALNSYENRVYQIGIINSDPIIAKFYRGNRWSDAAILEEHAFSMELAEYEIPIVPPIIINDKSLHKYAEFRFAIFKKKSGRPIELGNHEQLKLLGRFIGRIHAIGANKSYIHRPILNVETQGYIPSKFLIENNFIPEYLKTNYCKIIEELLDKISQSFINAGPIHNIRLHGDCHIGNILWNENGPQIVDLDDSLSGPAMQDIWLLLSGDASQKNLELDLILEGYQQFYDFNFKEINLLESLRTLRMIQYAGWLASRWDDPAFTHNFYWFNTPHYWQVHLQDLSEQSFLLSL